MTDAEYTSLYGSIYYHEYNSQYWAFDFEMSSTIGIDFYSLSDDSIWMLDFGINAVSYEEEWSTSHEEAVTAAACQTQEYNSMWDTTWTTETRYEEHSESYWSE